MSDTTDMLHTYQLYHHYFRGSGYWSLFYHLLLLLVSTWEPYDLDQVIYILCAYFLLNKVGDSSISGLP